MSSTPQGSCELTKGIPLSWVSVRIFLAETAKAIPLVTWRLISSGMSSLDFRQVRSDESLARVLCSSFCRAPTGLARLECTACRAVRPLICTEMLVDWQHAALARHTLPPETYAVVFFKEGVN